MGIWAALKLLWANRELITWILRLVQKGITAIEIKGRLQEVADVVEKAEKEDRPELIDDWFAGKRK